MNEQNHENIMLSISRHKRENIVLLYLCEIHRTGKFIETGRLDIMRDRTEGKTGSNS